MAAEAPKRWWSGRLSEAMDQPRMAKAASILRLVVVVQASAAVLSTVFVRASGQYRMDIYLPMLVSGTLTVIAIAALTHLLARRDPDAATTPSRLTLGFAAVVFGLFGTSMSFLQGFWASPFLLLCAVSSLIIGVAIGRKYGWVALGTGIVSLVVLELARAAGLVEYAPALLTRSVDGSSAILRVVASAIPLGTFTALAVGLCFCILRSNEEHQEALARSHDLIRRYVPAQVADAILVGGEETTRLERRKLTIFFSDIVNFTETTDRMEPEELALILDEYFSEMTRIAQKYDGTIDELIGDAVLIFFGAPAATDDRDHALRAVRMAVEMQRAAAALNARWEDAGIDAGFRVRMGINTGVVTVGNVGTGQRRKYAALGRAVNLAARIQTHSAPGEILLSRPTWLLIRGDLACSSRGQVDLKGVGRPVELYAVEPVHADSWKAAP
ncbi:MAG: adenylate/guanylate cyclase domain-containing protein [Aeromicrobium sp.]|uniref:adenylate/guanylate cyclase domain-containing protein n=1 Tax=Aeromicrobium sp. TaxID=1871063 RepID=UPI0039E32836